MSGTAQIPPAVFVVGSSRSGTTLMSRILGRHPLVFSFHELHFFEQLYAGPAEAPLGRDEAIDLFAELIAIQRDGYLRRREPARYRDEAAAALGDATATFDRGAIFRRFVAHEAALAGARIACDHTPRNALFLDYVFHVFPDARVIAMVRDPRAVTLSQKLKWKRRFLGGKSIPLREAMRSWINYHPVTVALLWRASLRATTRHRSDGRVLVVRYEDLASRPEETIRQVCAHVGIDFVPEMLHVPHVGSSTRADAPDAVGIDASRSTRWREGGLGNAETFLVERVTRAERAPLGYGSEGPRALDPLLALHALTFPLKIGAAALVNLGRTRNLREAIARRLGRA